MQNNTHSGNGMKKDLSIAFLGTPDFAAASLEAIVSAGFKVAVVVTAPDKPAGRGKRLKAPAVKEVATKMGLPLLQPEKLKNPVFIEQFKNYGATLGVVVAFRMLPEIIWTMPKYGTFNLHASLLPQYRGAAPINRAIMNGEHETGITTFFLQHEIDTGDLILSERVPIGMHENAGSLHDKLMVKGAQLVVDTIRLIEQGNYSLRPQANVFTNNPELKTAPKLFKEDCLINWQRPGEEIYNQIRGLSPLPGAFTYLVHNDNTALTLKIYACRFSNDQHQSAPGQIESDGKSYFSITTVDGKIYVDELQLQGKNRMNVRSFLNGFNLLPGWSIWAKKVIL
jgi:methionyl-tRNA formyltransferase